MSVTWVDPPNVAISRREPLDFIVTTNPVAISVKFPSLRAEERVYRDGAFQYPYLNSTVTGSGPYTFHLNRTGGWPEDSTVYVDEGGAVDSGPQPWGVLYEVDFSTLEVQSFLTNGMKTIDGLDWWLKGTFTQGGGIVQSADLDGVGLRLRTNFSSEGTDAATNLRWFLPLANVPDFNPAAPIAVFGRLSSTSTGTSLSNAIIGLASAAADAASFTLSERQTRIGVGTRYTVTNNVEAWVHNSPSPTSHNYAVGPEDVYNGLQRLAPTVTRRLVQPVSAGTPNPDGTEGISSPNSDAVRLHNTMAIGTLGVYFAANFNGGSTQDFHLRNLIIMQPGA